MLKTHALPSTCRSSTDIRQRKQRSGYCIIIFLLHPFEAQLLVDIYMGITENPVLQTLKTEAAQIAHREPLLAVYMRTCILNHSSLTSCLAAILAHKVSDLAIPAAPLMALFESVYADEPELSNFISHDLEAVYLRDPATLSYVSVVVNQKGFQSIQLHRLAHHLWNKNRKDLATYIQSRNAEVFGVDIHPACKIGKAVMFDHATGIVIGETCVIEDNVSIMQSVTLGGTGKQTGERHPKIRRGVLIGAGAKILGNIEIGEGAKIGAGSVVLAPVARHTTVVGVPAKMVGIPHSENPAETMEHNVLED